MQSIEAVSEQVTLQATAVEATSTAKSQTKAPEQDTKKSDAAAVTDFSSDSVNLSNGLSQVQAPPKAENSDNEENPGQFESKSELRSLDDLQQRVDTKDSSSSQDPGRSSVDVVNGKTVFKITNAEGEVQLQTPNDRQLEVQEFINSTIQNSQARNENAGVDIQA